MCENVDEVSLSCVKIEKMGNEDKCSKHSSDVVNKPITQARRMGHDTEHEETW